MNTNTLRLVFTQHRTFHCIGFESIEWKEDIRWLMFIYYSVYHNKRYVDKVMHCIGMANLNRLVSDYIRERSSGFIEQTETKIGSHSVFRIVPPCVGSHSVFRIVAPCDQWIEGLCQSVTTANMVKLATCFSFNTTKLCLP